MKKLIGIAAATFFLFSMSAFAAQQHPAAHPAAHAPQARAPQKASPSATDTFPPAAPRRRVRQCVRRRRLRQAMGTPLMRIRQDIPRRLTSTPALASGSAVARARTITSIILGSTAISPDRSAAATSIASSVAGRRASSSALFSGAWLPMTLTIAPTGCGTPTTS